MSKPQSPATELRYVRADLREHEKLLKECRAQLEHYRGRASKAEADAAEWKQRFDRLLAHPAFASKTEGQAR